MLRKRQSRKIFVVTSQTMFRKVQRTEISLAQGVGALHLNKWLIVFTTNITVRCTF